MAMKQKARRWGKATWGLFKAVRRELVWGITGEHKVAILAGAATGALVGSILGTYGYYTWLAEARGPALFYFVTAVIAFVGTTGANWWMDKKQNGRLHGEARGKTDGMTPTERH